MRIRERDIRIFFNYSLHSSTVHSRDIYSIRRRSKNGDALKYLLRGKIPLPLGCQAVAIGFH